MKKKGTGENYLIFARKFRPETFGEIVGQEAIVQMLRNAIRSGRIPQSFLFAGPRGIGKTSTARILAKALNCVKGPTETPCNACTPCQEITRAISLDVLEIDGASNRGIDEIRTLRENVKFKPAEARFKLYLIDEVHMLTGEAFNALLKTLEEPPEHVKFIFATTEPHKVPLTILSRCQRFNFKRIPVETLVSKLEEIAQAEGLKADSKALYQIARVSDGSLRDAESLLDQLSTLSEKGVREEEVLFALGLAGEDAYLELLEALAQKEARRVLRLTQELYESGKDLAQFGRGVFELFRNLLLLQIGGGAESYWEGSPESRKRFERFKNIFSREELLLILTLFQNLQGDLRRAIAPPRILLETALLKVLHLEGLEEVKTLLGSHPEGPAPAWPAGRCRQAGEGPEGSRGPSSPPRHASLAGSGTQDDQATRPQDDAGTRPQNESARQKAAPQSLSFSLNDLEQAWPKIVETVKAKQMSTGMFLAESFPVEITDEAIVLGFPEEFQFHKETLEAPEKCRVVEEACRQVLGEIPPIRFVTTRVNQEGAQLGKAEKPASKLPEAVRQAMDIFQGSKIVRAE